MNSSARIVRVSRDQAQSFMQKFEHLGDVGLGVWHFGMLVDEALQSVLSLGVPCFSEGRGELSQLAMRHGVRIIQLCRGGTSTSAPKNTGSRAIALMLRAVEQQFGAALVVAYADPFFGEVGTIYQASNAVHTGWTRPKGQANYIVLGRRMSGWTVRKKFGTRSEERLREIDPEVTVEHLRPKLRYVLVASSGAKRKVLLRDLDAMKRPYPKREELGIRRMVSEG